jgi:hypothetical protein
MPEPREETPSGLSVPMAAVLLVATFTVHLPNGFSSIKLLAVTAAGAQFGQPGYETDPLYLACLLPLSWMAVQWHDGAGGDRAAHHTWHGVGFVGRCEVLDRRAEHVEGLDVVRRDDAGTQSVSNKIGHDCLLRGFFLGTLGANADFYDPFQDNARRWYRESQARVLYWNHAIIHPPVDRNRPPDEVADVFVHVEEERDNGLIVSGAKVVATGSAITHMNFIAHYGILLKKKEYALICTIPMGRRG